MRTIIIGDVHGCLDELLALVRRCGGTEESRIVLVGDLVAKGPDSAGVLQWARESRVDAVLGNHDEKVLRLRPGTDQRAAAKVKPHHLEVAASLTAASWEWLAARPLWLSPDPDHLVVHAGLVPGVPLDEQERDHLLNMRSITPEGRPSSRFDGVPWASRWRGPAHVVFGHDAVRGLQQHPHATGLDTGCVYGNALTAVVLPEHQLVSVPALRPYASMKKAPAP